MNDVNLESLDNDVFNQDFSGVALFDFSIFIQLNNIVIERLDRNRKN